MINSCTDRRRVWAPALALLLATGCYQGSGSGSGDTDGNSGSASDSASGGTDSDTAGGTDGAAEIPAPTARTFRLTHQQWENTVQDLFRLSQPTGFSADFRDDPFQSGFIFDNNFEALSVDELLWTGYRVAAADVAELVTTDATILDGILPPDGGDATARRDQFISEFLLRAFRRPPTAQEETDYQGIFEAAPMLYPGVEPFTAGVRFVIEAALQSPHFLYRIESSTTVDGDMIPLDSWEVASRVSYLLWNSMPDDTLFEAAQNGELTDRAMVEAEARRLLADARAAEVVTAFHSQLLEVDTFASVNPSPAFFPDAPAELGALGVEESERFLRDILFGDDGSFADLLTSNETFVNDELAAIYGLGGGFDASWQRVTLDANRRAGIFTQIGFLAHNSSSVNPDPIHRGAFMAKRMACLPIAAPPDNVPPLPPQEDGQTNRETVENHTEQDGTVCISCHKPLINPYGFVFENYDAIGAWRDEDNGFPVNASSSPVIDGQATPVTGAVELMNAMAADPGVHECYTTYWLEFANGRPSVDEDAPLATRLGAASVDDDLPISELLVEIVTSVPFLNRSPEEL